VDLTDFEPHARFLARRYKLYGRVAADEQDVFQEAMIAAWVALGKWKDRGNGDPRGYVKQIMEFRVIDCVRDRANGVTDRDTIGLPEEREGPDQTLETVLEHDRLHTLIDTMKCLRPLQRSRLLGQAEGSSRQMMATESGCTITAIDRSLWEGRQAIKLALDA
jgi:RNA polymerase sigma factor (sigma-70 family)